MSTWVYVFDEFKLIDIDTSKLFELAEEDPLRLFEIIQDLLEGLGAIEDVKVYDIYFNPKSLDLVVEYIVKCSLGEVSVKLIHSKDVRKTLASYYEYEKKRLY